MIAVAAVASAQQLPADSLASNADVARFYAGCMKIAEAETSADDAARNAAYSQAVDLLNTRTRGSRKGLNMSRLRLQVADSTGIAADGIKNFAYDYTYARARYRGTDFAPKGVSRAGALSGCRVADMVLSPGASVRCTEFVHGNCLLVAVAQPGATVGLKVTDSAGRDVPVRTYEDGMTAYAHWQNGDRGEVCYTLSNPSDKEITIALIAN